MKAKVSLGGKELEIVSNALLPRKYRREFGRDLLVDMKRLSEAYQKDPDGVDTEVLENVTWMMLREGGNDVGESVEDWLASQDDLLEVYSAINEVVALWLTSQKTTSKPKKK